MISGILFDFDMTLIDTSPALLFNINKIAKKFGLRKCTMDFLMERIGLNSRDFWVELLGSYKTEYMDYYRKECMPTEAMRMAPTPGAVECVTSLREKGIKVGCASNRVHPMRVIEAKGLAPLMDCVVGAEMVKNPKPAPDVLLLGAKLLHCTPEETIYVGDTDLDVEAAKRANMRSIVLTTSTPRAKLETVKPWQIIDTLKELTPLLQNTGEFSKSS